MSKLLQSGWFFRIRRAVPFVLAAALAALPGLAAADEGYKLDVMDKLQVRVAEWQSAEGAVRDWPSISGSYTIGPAGTISLPFVGDLPAKGKTALELSEAIADGLQRKLGLSDKPEASVEIAEFRPVFVFGDVQSPGKYPYMPDLTTLKALSLAGGTRRAEGGSGGPRDFVSAQGNYQMLVTQRNGLVARRARLITEQANKDKVEFPEELTKTAAGRKLMKDEAGLLVARQRKHKLQMAALDDLKKLLAAEIDSLGRKIVTQSRQIELSRTDLKSVAGLADKGLIKNDRIRTLEQSIADLEGKKLDMETASLRARQDLSKATQDQTTLQQDRETEIAQNLQQTESDIDTLGIRIGMFQALMEEALVRAPEAAQMAKAGSRPAIVYHIVRTVDGKSSEMQADETTAILPGDVVKIEVEPTGVTSN